MDRDRQSPYVEQPTGASQTGPEATAEEADQLADLSPLPPPPPPGTTVTESTDEPLSGVYELPPPPPPGPLWPGSEQGNNTGPGSSSEQRREGSPPEESRLPEDKPDQDQRSDSQPSARSEAAGPEDQPASAPPPVAVRASVQGRATIPGTTRLTAAELAAVATPSASGRTYQAGQFTARSVEPAEPAAAPFDDVVPSKDAKPDDHEVSAATPSAAVTEPATPLVEPAVPEPAAPAQTSGPSAAWSAFAADWQSPEPEPSGEPAPPTEPAPATKIDQPALPDQPRGTVSATHDELAEESKPVSAEPAYVLPAQRGPLPGGTTQAKASVAVASQYRASAAEVDESALRPRVTNVYRSSDRAEVAEAPAQPSDPPEPPRPEPPVPPDPPRPGPTPTPAPIPEPPTPAPPAPPVPTPPAPPVPVPPVPPGPVPPVPPTPPPAPPGPVPPGPTPAPPFPPPPASFGAQASGPPTSAPPGPPTSAPSAVVPAPALPSWPPSAPPVAPGWYGGNGGQPNQPTSPPSISQQPIHLPHRGSGQPGNAAAAVGPFAGTQSAHPPAPAWNRPAASTEATATVPGQRRPVHDQLPGGTIYGGPEGHITVAVPTRSPVENTGSLTGHILAQGWADAPTSTGSTAKVVIILLVSLGILITVGLLIVFAADDTLGTLFDGLLQ